MILLASATMITRTEQTLGATQVLENSLQLVNVGKELKITKYPACSFKPSSQQCFPCYG